MNARCLFLSLLVFTNVLLDACGGGSGHVDGMPSFASTDATQSDSPGAATPGTYAPPGSSDWPHFIYPQPGDPNVDITQPVQWTAANNAQTYQLQIGTTLGGNDVFDSGVIAATSIAMPPLPAAVVLYARVRAVYGTGDDSPDGHWHHGSYTQFRTDDQTVASTFTNVAGGETLPAGVPLEWTASPLALGYRLNILGTAVNATLGGVRSDIPLPIDIEDSGVIHTTRMFVDAFAGATVSATLETIYLTRAVSTKVSFKVAPGMPSFADEYNVAKEMTAEVRSMADLDNQPYGATLLDQIAGGFGESAASCEEFMLALRQMLDDARVSLDARTLNIAFQENGYDTHTLVEIFDNTLNRWSTLDPTFGLVTLRSDGVPATSGEISADVRAQNWSALNYEFLTDAGDAYVSSYYLDYPLLYMDVDSLSGSGLVQDPPATLAPYFDELPLPVSSGTQTAYSLRCASGFASATADVNSAAQTMSCSGADQLTWVFWANTIQAASGDDSVSAVWQVRRFTF